MWKVESEIKWFRNIGLFIEKCYIHLKEGCHQCNYLKYEDWKLQGYFQKLEMFASIICKSWHCFVNGNVLCLAQGNPCLQCLVYSKLFIKSQ